MKTDLRCAPHAVVAAVLLGIVLGIGAAVLLLIAGFLLFFRRFFVMLIRKIKAEMEA